MEASSRGTRARRCIPARGLSALLCHAPATGKPSEGQAVLWYHTMPLFRAGGVCCDEPCPGGTIECARGQTGNWELGTGNRELGTEAASCRCALASLRLVAAAGS